MFFDFTIAIMMIILRITNLAFGKWYDNFPTGYIYEITQVW